MVGTAIDGILPHLDRDLLMSRLRAAGGNEIDSGKLNSPESSAALAVNFFGLFSARPTLFPGIPGLPPLDAPVTVDIEKSLRFPWSGGRHPWLDVVVETPTMIVGIESKRYEPYRSKPRGHLSQAYWRPVWGENMRRFEKMRDKLSHGSRFVQLDAVQLVKHAFGLRTAASHANKSAILVYIFAEPTQWPDARPINEAARLAHRDEIRRFAEAIAGDEVSFLAISYAEMLARLTSSPDSSVQHHASCIMRTFSPL